MRRQGSPKGRGSKALSKPALISIVDDDRSIRAALARLLMSLDYETEVYTSAEDFLLSDRRDVTDCLIADVRMPGMTGLELFHRLMETGRAIPTILMTAHGSERERMIAIRAGVLCYLTKPVDGPGLMKCISRALERLGSDVQA